MIQSPVGHESSEIRVILVGQTGLDAALRRDPAIELIRSRTPLDAIGELADPIDDTSPTRSVVIVAPDAEPDAARTRQFIDGLRLVDPHVRVLCVKNGKAGNAALYDAQVEASGVGNAEPSEALLAAIRGEAAPRAKSDPTAALDASMPPASVPSPASSSPPPALRIVGGEAEDVGTPDSSDAAGEDSGNAKDAKDARSLDDGAGVVPANGDRLLERKPSLTGVGDEHLAAEIIRGRDPRELALQVLRARLGDRRIELLDVATAEPAAAGAARVPVRWGEHDLGLLEADGVSARDLQRHADWLAAWLRLDQQHRDLRDAAYRDPLTGAWNRRYFDRFFDAALAKSRDGRHNLTLLVFDIDDFKVYNDRYGHGAGDEILIETVRLLQSVV
ncbi:MAG: GGDEF domain-containing protein, partial [Phycisphaerales bacterium]|nr:GGDEF domain-containing protein [Phycisphaerales bacterium]